MTNDRQFTTWSLILLITQIIHLVFGLSFAYQHKYPQAVLFLFSSIMCIGTGKNSHPIIKFLNRIILGFALVITVHWYTQ